MRLLVLFACLFCPLAGAGIVRVTTYPVRHPVRSVRCAARTVLFPVLHPKRTSRAVTRVIW